MDHISNDPRPGGRSSESAIIDPALGVLELASIARGLVVVDALVKRARVRLIRAEAITPGKYLVLFGGGEGEVDESFRAAIEVAGDRLIDSLHLSHVDEEVAVDAGTPRAPRRSGDSLGVLEFTTVSATLAAADAARKAAPVELVAMDLARGIGGHGYFAVGGTLEDVEAAVEAGDARVEPAKRIGREVIARPHAELTFAVDRLGRR